MNRSKTLVPFSLISVGSGEDFGVARHLSSHWLSCMLHGRIGQGKPGGDTVLKEEFSCFRLFSLSLKQRTRSSVSSESWLMSCLL